MSIGVKIEFCYNKDPVRLDFFVVMQAHLDTPSQEHCHTLHTHSVHDIEQRIFLAKQACHTQGLRFTPLRERVYRLILQSTAPIGAYELLAQLQQQSTKKIIAPPTVYRSLDFLLAHGFIHQLNSANAFIPCCHPRNQHIAAFLICQNCKQVQEFSTNAVHDLLSHITQQTQFSIQSSVIEISGICQTCQSLLNK